MPILVRVTGRGPDSAPIHRSPQNAQPCASEPKQQSAHSVHAHGDSRYIFLDSGASMIIPLGQEA